MAEERNIFTAAPPYPPQSSSHISQYSMPLAKALAPLNQKRKLCTETESPTPQLQPTAKRQKQENRTRHRTPPSFWDNLSRQWLCPRALREFDRRTTPLEPPSQPDLPDLTWARPTELKRFARHGGPGLSDIRGYPEPSSISLRSLDMSSSQSRSRNRGQSSSTSKKTSGSGTRTSAYDPGFAQHLADHGVFMKSGGGKPHNWEGINGVLTQPRPSLSPSRFTETAFESFRNANEEAENEQDIMSTVFPIITGRNDTPSSRNIEFNNLAPLTNGDIKNAKPDFYDGSRPSTVDRRLRKELASSIVPSTNHSRPCLPNFFTEAKGPDGSAAVVKRQACYDGAVGARGMHELRSYVDPATAFDNNAYTITSTYSGGAGGGVLTLYTTHPSPSENPDIAAKYRMTQLNSYAVTGNADTFRQGAAALRNARDWAKEKREDLILAANGTTLNAGSSTSQQSTQSMLSQSTIAPLQDSETSADELAADIIKESSIRPSTPTSGRRSRRDRTSSTRRSKKEALRADRRPGMEARSGHLIS